MKFLLLILFFEYSSEETCMGNTPFILPDKSCGSFNDVCLKKGNKECDNLQVACQQCPPTNYTILMLVDVIKGHRNITNGLNSMNSTLHIIKEVVQLLKNNVTSVFIILTIGFIGLCILNIILHVEKRSKFIRKLFNTCGLKFTSRKYDLIDNLQLNNNNSKFLENLLKGQIKSLKTDLSTQISENLKTFETKFSGRLDRIESEISSLRSKIKSTEISGYEMKFKIEKTDVVLLISPDDNIVVIKRMICGKLVFSEPDDFKIMEIQFNGHSIDHNELLLTHVKHQSLELMCNINKSKNPKSIFVLRLIGNNVKRLIQIDEDKSFEDLQNIIKGLNKSDNKLFIPKSLNEFDLIDVVDPKQKIKDSKIKDNDYIRVIVEKQSYFNLTSILEKLANGKIKYSNVEKIVDLKERIRKKLNCNLENIFLFENFFLNDKKFIFEYQFIDGQILNYCQFTNCKETDFEIEKEYKSNDKYKIFRGKYSGSSLMIKGYSKPTANFENEMVTFNLTKQFDNKIKLKFASKSDQFYYICVKYEKSIEDILNESFQIIDENQIAKWTRDILNGLNEFHDKNVSHPGLKVSKIIICQKNNIANISLFGSIENNPNYDNRGILGESENYNTEKCNEIEDIRNLGGILLEIINSKCYCREKYKNILEKANYTHRNDISEKFKMFLNSCLDDDIQATVKILLSKEFVKISENKKL